MSSTNPPGAPSTGDPDPDSLSADSRREILTAFFARWPGDDAHPLGLGRALVEFQEWEIESGRIAESGGSPWWMTVNCRLVRDVAAAAAGAEGAWADYTSAPPEDRQGRLWAAHQESIRCGVERARPLLGDESDTEQRFIATALAVVDMAAAVELRTSSSAMGRRTAELYPRRYPCSEQELERLERELNS